MSLIVISFKGRFCKNNAWVPIARLIYFMSSRESVIQSELYLLTSAHIKLVKWGCQVGPMGRKTQIQSIWSDGLWLMPNS